jgi:hypothetical protein
MTAIRDNLDHGAQVGLLGVQTSMIRDEGIGP